MPLAPLKVTRRPEYLLSDDKRVILRLFDLSNPRRLSNIFNRVLEIPEKQVADLLSQVMAGFASRHRDVAADFQRHCDEICARLHTASAAATMSPQRQLLIGAYFTMEYSIEAAALFNPSVVVHPDQRDVPPGSVRFLMSLRATGEGHISSIVFRRGIVDAHGNFSFEPPPAFAYTARPVPDQTFHKTMFKRKLRDMGAADKIVTRIIDQLPDEFRASQLHAVLAAMARTADRPSAYKTVADELTWLSQANYSLTFPGQCRPAEIVIFPATRHEQRGMEDLRLVAFKDDHPDSSQITYYGTYTAYDGSHTHPMLLETADFCSFHVSTLSGRYVHNKGMALFPRKVNGHYTMLARHDGENLYLLQSQNMYIWNKSQKLQSPVEPWELVQIGNCGSPIETPEGWIVLTHGVGPLRQYCIGAILLDLERPWRVIGRLRQPLLRPDDSEREGYVPNVVYTCGIMQHHGMLIIPYAMSDSRTSFATIEITQLLAHLKAENPRQGLRRRRQPTPAIKSIKRNNPPPTE